MGISIMFRRKSNRQVADDLLGSMSEQERIETRSLAIGVILGGLPRELGTKSAPGALHLFTAGDASARKHAGWLKKLFDGLGFTVARLSAGDSDRARANAYQADLIVGSFTAFAADLGRETALKITRYAVMIEGGPEAASSGAERTLLSAYRQIYPG
jgi:hypothetical protein